MTEEHEMNRIKENLIKEKLEAEKKACHKLLWDHFVHKDLDSFFNTLDSKCSIKDFCEFKSMGKNFLHLSCDLGNQSLAVQFVDKILQRVSSRSAYVKFLFDLVNEREDPNGRTPLEIALCKNNQKIIDALIRNSADVTYTLQNCTTPIDEIYHRFHFLMIKMFDRNIELIRSDYDPSNKLLWRVKYNYRPIVGVRTKLDSDEMLPTALLVKVLPMPTAQLEEVLTHPLTCMFVNDKSLSFKWWKWTSIGLHISFYILTALILSTLAFLPPNSEIPGQEDENSNNENCQCPGSSNRTITSSIIQNTGEFLTADFTFWCIFFVTYCFFFVFFCVKEYSEIKLSPNLCYYWRQFENVGQWLLLSIFIALVSWKFLPEKIKLDSSCFPTYFCTAGVFLSFLLVQGQLTKIEHCGIYNLLLRKAVLRFARFSGAYCATFVAFSLVFNHLLHQEREWFGSTYGFVKTFIMFTGEVDYKDTFHDDPEISDYHRVLNANFYFIVFVTILTILLQNILIALTVDDIQALLRNCHARHIAAELELIHILEGFQKKMSPCYNYVHNRVRTLPVQVTGANEDGVLLEGDGQPGDNTLSEGANSGWIEKDLVSLPEKIQTCVKDYFQKKDSVAWQKILLQFQQQNPV